MKKGQKSSGNPAAALIGLMTLLFILYILFLPPGEREALLEGEEYDNGVSFEGEILLDEGPGRIEFIESNVIDHQLSNIFLAAEKEATILAKGNPFMIKNGWFRDKTKTMIFTIPYLDRTDNIILSFQAPVRRGILQISLNGQPIYQANVAIQNPPPVTLPKQLLQTSNQLTFSVGGSWLSRRKYEIVDVKVIGDVVDESKQAATSTFSISNTEIENLDTAALDFYPLCRQADVGPMTLTLNGKIISTAIPSCESLNRQELYKEDLLKGKNVLTWHIDQGSYRIEQIRVRTTLEDVKTYIDYFKVNSSLYNKLLNDKREIFLKIDFVDDETRKHARLNINGNFDIIDQDEPDYEEEITRQIVEGNNYIEIRPLTELNVARVRVEVE